MSSADLRLPSVTRAPADQQGTPGLPASAATAEARLKASPRHGEWVKVAWEAGSSDSLMAWVVYPAARAKAPVVVVVHEIYGLTTWVRGVADQVAAEGFIAIAPDFNSRVRGGPSTTELSTDSASRIIRGVTPAERDRAIIAAANHAMMQPSAEPRYAVIGYCWGGQTVFNHAIHGGVKGFSGGVAYYGLTSYMTAGQRATATSSAVASGFIVDSLAKIKVPVMLLNGSKDARIAAAMPALDSLMKSMKKDYVGINYEGAIHGFLRAQNDPRVPRAATDTRPAPTAADDSVFASDQKANLAASRDAWPKTVAFLKKNLGVK
jgi:carboxymethylenebutenolidase